MRNWLLNKRHKEEIAGGIIDSVVNMFNRSHNNAQTYVNQYSLAGMPLSGDRSPGLIALNAVGSLVATNPVAAEFVDELWALEPPSGQWRYYDGLLYLMSMLHVSGNFRYP